MSSSVVENCSIQTTLESIISIKANLSKRLPHIVERRVWRNRVLGNNVPSCLTLLFLLLFGVSQLSWICWRVEVVKLLWHTGAVFMQGLHLNGVKLNLFIIQLERFFEGNILTALQDLDLEPRSCRIKGILEPKFPNMRYAIAFTKRHPANISTIKVCRVEENVQ